MAKREKLEIIHDILQAVKGGNVKPTHILYKSNLSHIMLKEYLTDLMDKGLVLELEEKKGKKYSLSEKGFNYLKDFGVIKSFMESYDLD